MKSYWKHFFLDNGDLSLIEAGLQKYEPTQINNYKVKHDIVFHIVLQGKGYYTVNDKHYDLKERDSFILKKNQHVYYVPDENDPWTICWLGMGGENMNTYLSKTTIPNNDVLTFEEDSSAFEEMKQFIYFLSDSEPDNIQDYFKIFSRFYHFLYSLNKEFPQTDTQSGYALSEPKLAEKIYGYIYENFVSDFTVNDIADIFNISRNYVFKLCKAHYGQSPKQIIQELRMNQASQLLRGSNSLVKEIASIVGYKDAFSFSKMFKEYYGYSPTQFRKLSEEEIDKALFIREEFLGSKVNSK